MGRIGLGLLVLTAVAGSDTETDADYLAHKIVGLRIFQDEEGRMNRNIFQVEGSLLVISQFTLYGDVRRGLRPSFDRAARPEFAKRLYDYFIVKLRQTGVLVETGIFQAHMNVELVNNGPVTIVCDSVTIATAE